MGSTGRQQTQGTNESVFPAGGPGDLSTQHLFVREEGGQEKRRGGGDGGGWVKEIEGVVMQVARGIDVSCIQTRLELLTLYRTLHASAAEHLEDLRRSPPSLPPPRPPPPNPQSILLLQSGEYLLEEARAISDVRQCLMEARPFMPLP